MHRMPRIALLVAILTVLAACGSGDSGSDSGTETTAASSGGQATETTAASSDDGGSDDGGDTGNDTTETTAASSGSDEIPAPPETGDAGFFTVNGQQIGVDQVIRCIPFSEGSIDLQARGRGAAFNLVMTDAGEILDPSVQGSYLAQEYGSNAWGDHEFGAGEIDFTGDRVTGATTVGDSYGTGETVDITWDIEVPAEEIDCSL